MKLLAKFNLILVVIFLAGGVLIAQLAHSFLVDNAQREVEDQGRLMLSYAASVRDYIGTEVSPLLEQSPEEKVHFLPETIPFYGAKTTFRNLHQSYPNYDYKETALNPTNLEDRPTDWETDIIQELRDHPSVDIVQGLRSTPMGAYLYMAHRIVAKPECLRCHSSPSLAPATLIASYGSANGFGWKPNEIVGAQIVSVPMSVPLAIANRAWRQLLVFLVAMMLAVIAALDAGVWWFVIRPLRLVSSTADRASRGDKDVPAVRINSRDEIATVAASFNRMQVSLAKALKMMEDE